MNKITINNILVVVKEYQGQRVVTLKDIDTVHGRPDGHYLNNQQNVLNTIAWITFFRRNLHRFAIDYLGILLYEYQALMIYFMLLKCSLVKKFCLCLNPRKHTVLLK